MARAAAPDTTTTELALRIQLHRAGMRLHRSGVSFQILVGNQVLLNGNASGEALSLEAIADFIRKSRVRP